MRYIFIVTYILLSFSATSQSNDSTTKLYDRCFDSLELGIKNNLSFKRAVFLVENTYLKNGMNYDNYNSYIQQLSGTIRAWLTFNPLKGYGYSDSTNLQLNLGIFKLLKDTMNVKVGSQELLILPYTYDFEDFFGHTEWSNMFVTKLLSSQKGNCHSLPYLYKILADELAAKCWLSLAPNHMYIRNRCKKIGWYNTELTSGDFPIDAWITTSGYIPSKAIQNGIYMDTLSNQQAIALCALDLAKGYEFQTKNYEDGFILKCCDLVLKHHPANVQALLLKAETLKRIYEKQQLDKDPNAKNTYNNMEQLYVKLFDLGYREMPEKINVYGMAYECNKAEKQIHK